jgi:hypothetical protein
VTIVIYCVGIEDKGKIMISRIKFRNDVNKYWTELCEYVESYTALTGTGQDPSSAQANILRKVAKIGDIVKPVYGPMFAYDITSNMQAMVSGLFEAVALIENDIETDALTTRVAGNVIANLTQKLAAANSAWPSEVTTPIFVNIWNGWLDQAKAKKANNVQGYMEAKNLSMNNAIAFADAFVNGTIQIFESMFF